MSLPARIEVENAIFARAAQVQSAVHANYGRLYSPSEDLQLQTLIYVYNVYFGADNAKQFCTAQERLEARQNYLAQRARPPGLTRIYSAKQLNFELILLEEK